MASIPLPALNVRTPEQPDLLQKFGQLQQLKAMQQQQAIQQQEAPLRMQALQTQAQTGQLQLQHDQQLQKDDQTFRAAMQDPSLQGKTVGQVADVLAQKGQISQAGWAQAKKLDLEHQEAVQKLDTGKLANLAAAHKQTQEIYNNAMNLPDDQLAASWPQIVQQVSAIPGNEKVQLNPNQPMTRQQLQTQVGPALGLVNGYLDQELARREAQAKVQTELAKPAHEAAQEKEMHDYHQQEIGVRKQGLSIENARLNFEKQKAANDGVGPEGAGLVDSIGTGKIAVDRLGYLVARNPGLLEAVSAKYPDFDSTKAGAYVNAYKDFTSTKAGSAGGALNAGATALGHLKELKELNTVASHIPGTPSYNAYMNKVDTVATELAKFYGDSTVSGIGAIRKTLASTLPGTRDAAITTQAQSMGDKFDSYEQSWQNAAPSKAYEAPMPGISQKAVEARAALDPRFHAAQVSKAAPTYKQTATGPGGHKIGSNDGTTWVDLQTGEPVK
jgi:hypothetical protein